MSVFQGKQGKDAMRVHRAKKVREAVERDAKAPRWNGVASPLGRKAREGEMDESIYSMFRSADGSVRDVIRAVTR